MEKKKRSPVRVQTGTKIHPRGMMTRVLLTLDMVENRARELALIVGREPNRITAYDRIQAKIELLCDDSADAAVDDTGIIPCGMGAPPASTGKQRKNLCWSP